MEWSLGWSGTVFTVLGIGSVVEAIALHADLENVVAFVDHEPDDVRNAPVV